MELDDLIRRGDAMLAAVDLGDERIADAIRALPARGVGVKPDSEAQFAEWFRKNYPGPDTIIHKPDWHAPRIFRAAIAALAPTDAAQAREKALREAAAAMLGPLSEMAGKSELSITVEWKDGPHKAKFTKTLKPDDFLALIGEPRA